AAVTKVEQSFRNHTDRQLEATYVFPVPKGASVKDFRMEVNGKFMKGELLPAEQARKTYTDIVRRTQDPGLLEYLGHNLFQFKVFPVLPRTDQRVELSFRSEAKKDGQLIEYTYPLKTNGKAASTLEKFAVNMTVKSQHKIQTVYSPTHSIAVKRPSDK